MLLWRLFSTDRSGAETEYQGVHRTPSALLRIKLDTPSACCGVFDFAKGIKYAIIKGAYFTVGERKIEIKSYYVILC